MLTAPIIAVSYDDATRDIIRDTLSRSGVNAILFSTFVDAESFLRSSVGQGCVVDLTTMIRAKAEEKIVACTITNFFPTLRVKLIGSMLIPMAMPGQSSQDKSFADFITKTCELFVPRKLRAHKRREIFIPLILTKVNGTSGELRCCTLNVSWNGMFIIDMYPEKYATGDRVTLRIADTGLELDATIVLRNEWGNKKMPGFGISFHDVSNDLEKFLLGHLKTNPSTDRDRIS